MSKFVCACERMKPQTDTRKYLEQVKAMLLYYNSHRRGDKMGVNNDQRNSLAIKNPELSKQWHPTKNGDLAPDDVTTGSGKKIWWQCEKGHEWEAAVYSRSNGRNCPYCSGRRVCADNSLQILNPELAKQWHPTKNGDLTPENVTVSSSKKAWWRCEREHIWEATVNNRARGNGCPYCSGRYACVDNSLQTLNPDLAKQWHPTKNGKLTPNDITTGAGKKVWWRCEKGHEWEAKIASRARDGNGCPVCSQEMQTSFPEQAIYFYLKSVFKDTLNGYKHNNKWEIDVFVPSLNFGIEYDGIYYHKDKEVLDSKKEEYITGEGICLLRVKETEKDEVKRGHENNIVYCCEKPSDSQLNEVIRACFDYISGNLTYRPSIVDVDVERDKIKIYDLYVKTEKEGSLFAKYPDLSEQWHPTKNLSMQPDMIKPGSEKRVWWLCEKGHEWEAMVYNRQLGRGCPYCSGKRACDDNSLQILNPDLARQWHPTKNGDLTPDDVTTGSSKKVWWLCKKGHEWEASIDKRSNGRDCPFCIGKRTCMDNSLETLNPDLAKQWHPAKNEDLTPDNVTIFSNKKVWWKCGKEHEWEAIINSRAKGSGCPFCSGKRAYADNSLQTLNPELAKQWHPTKNGNLMPSDVTTGSHKKIWWLCEKGHEWEAAIYNSVDRQII